MYPFFRVLTFVILLFTELHESIDLTDEFFSESVDDILNRVDFNWDGYIDYPEYASSVSFEQVKEFHQEYQTVVASKQTDQQVDSPGSQDLPPPSA